MLRAEHDAQDWMASGVLPEAAWSETAGGIICTPAAFGELSGEILRAGNGLRFRAHGASMAPLVRDGDVLLVRPAGPGSVRIGDVILCSGERGRVVVHRVIKKANGPGGLWFTVQGDALAEPDEPIPAAQVYGRVVAIERGKTEIAIDRPGIRTLGWLAVLRSRRNLGSDRFCRLATRVLGRLPGFSKYLA